MALLKDSVVTGDLRVTNNLYSTTAQFQILKAPSTSGGTDYGLGTAGYLLKTGTNGMYWSALSSSDIPTLSITDKTSGILTVARGGTGVTSVDANKVFAGPISGSAAAPSFRKLDKSDLLDFKTRIIETKSLASAGWYRILDCTVYSMSFFITFYGGYNNQPPTPVTFLVSHSYNTTKIEQIGRVAYIGWITKIRAIHYETSKFYIDIYYSGTANNYANYEITPLDPQARNSITKVGYTLITDELTPNAICETTETSHADIANSCTGTAAKAIADANNNTISSTYLKLSGGTMTGVFTAKGSQYDDSITSSTSHAINMNNSNIIGLNAIYTADASDGAAEGINFYRDATHFDTLWMSGGDLLFVPNRALGTNTSKADSQKVGRFTTNPTTGQVVITDGTTGGIKSSGYTIATSVPANAVFTDHYAWTEITGKPDTFTPSSHTHGNLTNDGKITSTTTIANGDKLVIVDSDNTAGSKITGSSITFDGSTTTKALSQAGTWITYAGGTAVTLNNSSKAASTASFYAPTAGGTADTQALVGNGATTAPKWVNISPSITIGAGTDSAAPTVNVTVLGQSGTAKSITTASTSVYGVTKLNDGVSSTSTTLAATANAARTAATCVNQSASSTSNWHKVLLHHADQSTSTATVQNETNVVYGAVGVSVQPSTGTLRASAFNTNDKVTLQWNNNDQTLDFVFA